MDVGPRAEQIVSGDRMNPFDEKRERVVRDQIASLEAISLKTLELKCARIHTDEVGILGPATPDENIDIEQRLQLMSTEYERIARELEMMLPSLPRKWRKVHKEALSVAKWAKSARDTLAGLKKTISQ